jgi:hypothetical protein
MKEARGERQKEESMRQEDRGYGEGQKIVRKISGKGQVNGKGER